MSTTFEGCAPIYEETSPKARIPHQCSACGPYQYESVGGGTRIDAGGICRRIPHRLIDHGPIDPSEYPIQPGDVYSRTAVLFDGEWEITKRCVRCEELYRHLLFVNRSSRWDEGIHRALDCGHDYEEAHGKLPPEHIDALAFWIRGTPLPVAS